MIRAFYAGMVVMAAAMLLYAIVSRAPTIAAVAVGAWEWWSGLPVVGYLNAVAGAGGAIPDLWDPWGAAAALVLAVAALILILSRAPRYIAGADL